MPKHLMTEFCYPAYAYNFVREPMLSTALCPVVKVRKLAQVACIRNGNGPIVDSLITEEGLIAFKRYTYKVLHNPTDFRLHVLIDASILRKASQRGRIMQAILGSPLDILYGKAKPYFSKSKEEQLRCRRLCLLTLRQLGVRT